MLFLFCASLLIKSSAMVASDSVEVGAASSSMAVAKPEEALRANGAQHAKTIVELFPMLKRCITWGVVVMPNDNSGRTLVIEDENARVRYIALALGAMESLGYSSPVLTSKELLDRILHHESMIQYCTNATKPIEFFSAIAEISRKSVLNEEALGFQAIQADRDAVMQAEQFSVWYNNMREEEMKALSKK